MRVHFRPTAIQANQSKQRRNLQLTPCGSPNDSAQALCGQYEVFENRAAQAGRKIKLNLVVLPALAAQPAPDPVFFLAGGPGQGAAGSARSGGGSLAQQLRLERDLVFVDQRGTGQSQQLDCNLYGADQEAQSYFNDLFPVDKVRDCRQELEKSADLKLYTTPVAMDDLDEVRAALGYAQINLYGASYGTLAALQYLRQHPAQVRSLTLAGVATPETKMPLHFAKGAQEAMEKLIADCATDETCRAAFPQFKTELAAVLARLDKGAVSFAMRHPAVLSFLADRGSRRNCRPDTNDRACLRRK
jgi:pimeloyl-ACP methyl ester carboxylesterase